MLVSFLMASNSAFLIIDIVSSLVDYQTNPVENNNILSQVGCVIPITFYLLILRLVLTRHRNEPSDGQHPNNRMGQISSAREKSPRGRNSAGIYRFMKTHEPQYHNSSGNFEPIEIHIHKVTEEENLKEGSSS